MLVNEVYAEVANKQADYSKNKLAAGDKFTIRFFIELLNPNNLEGTTTAGVTVDQSARSGGNAPLQFPAIGSFPAFSSYRVQVYDNAIAVNNEVNSTANRNYVLGHPSAATATANLKLQASFVGMNNYVTPAQPGLTQLVEPNNGAFTANATQRSGFCVVGPDVDPATTESPKTAYAPQSRTAPTATSLDGWMLVKPTPAAATMDQLEYDSPVAAVDPDQILPQVVNPANANGHAVVLQRLANPYLPPNGIVGDPGYNPALPYNPYITVDSMGGVKVNDAVRIGLKPVNKPDGTRATPATPDKSFAMGRVQPYVGFQTLAAAATPTTPVFQLNPTTAPTVPTLSLLQDPQPPPPATDPRNTFFRHNSQQSSPIPSASDTTLTLPFTEPTHPDRRLVNSLEALHVSMAPSHLLTPRFWSLAVGNPPPQPLRYQHELSRVALPAAAGTLPSLLYRALEVLNVKPWTYGVPHAGRTPGGVNINLINDEVAAPVTPPMLAGDSAVFSAVMDKQAANVFTDADVNTLWKAVRASRSPGWTTPVPAVGATVDEIDPATNAPGKDRPFKAFGVGQYDAAAPAGVLSAQGLESTLLRSGSTPGTALFLNTTQADPYRQLELLRKATNNLTTVSDNFLVVFTVGFFDIDEPSLPRVVLRREAYESVPGDLRSQFTAVLDRTGLAMNPNASGDTGRFAQAAAATNLEPLPGRSASGKQFKRFRLRFPASGQHPTTNDIQVRDMPTVSGTNSTVFTVAAGTRLRLGDGPNADVLTVSATEALGGQYNFNKSPVAVLPQLDYPIFDAVTGLATVIVEVEVDAAGNAVAGSRLPNLHFAGELISLADNEAFANVTPPASTTIFVPGNPGKVTNFSPNDARFRGVVRYFGQLKP